MQCPPSWWQAQEHITWHLPPLHSALCLTAKLSTETPNHTLQRTFQCAVRTELFVQMPPLWGIIQTANLLIPLHTTLTALINLEMNTRLALLDSHLCFLQPDTSQHELYFHGFKSWLRNAPWNWLLLELMLGLQPLLCCARMESHLREQPHAPCWLFALVNQPPGWLFLLLSFLINASITVGHQEGWNKKRSVWD